MPIEERKKKVVISRHLYGFVGGGEMLTSSFVKAFKRMGYDVSIASVAKFKKDDTEKYLDVDLNGIKVYSIFPKYIPFFGIYQRLISHHALRKAIEKERPDYLYVDYQLYKPILKTKKKYGYKLIHYIHFPEAIYIEDFKNVHDPEKVKLFREDQREYMGKYLGKGWWNLYYKIWSKLAKRILVEDPFEYADYVLANSEYTAEAVHALYGKIPEVLYPPAETEIFKNFSLPYEERQNAVVMIGRIAREKRHKIVIDAISKTRSKPKLKIVGGLSPADEPYKSEIERFAKEKSVEVEFHINVPREEVAREAGSSKVFVHAIAGEHFGIAVVEGMASGTPVIVHRSGGAYYSIVNKNKFGKSFETVDELASEIDMLMKNENEWKRYSELSRKRAEDFNEQKFYEKVYKLFGS